MEGRSQGGSAGHRGATRWSVSRQNTPLRGGAAGGRTRGRGAPRPLCNDHFSVLLPFPGGGAEAAAAANAPAPATRVGAVAPAGGRAQRTASVVVLARPPPTLVPWRSAVRRAYGGRAAGLLDDALRAPPAKATTQRDGRAVRPARATKASGRYPAATSSSRVTTARSVARELPCTRTGARGRVQQPPSRGGAHFVATQRTRASSAARAQARLGRLAPTSPRAQRRPRAPTTH